MKLLLLSLITCAFTAVIAFAEAKPKDERSAPAPEKVAAIPNLIGTSWTLKSWSDKKLDPNTFRINVSFNDKNGKSYLHGFGGVNNYSGFYEANADGSFSVGTIGSTERLSNDGEDLYYSLLPQVRKYLIDGKKLVLSDKEGKELLVFEKN